MANNDPGLSGVKDYKVENAFFFEWGDGAKMPDNFPLKNHPFLPKYGLFALFLVGFSLILFFGGGQDFFLLKVLPCHCLT